MPKIIFLFFCIPTMSLGMDQTTTEMWLVTHNTGKKQIPAFPMTHLWNEEKADLSHIKTYDGKAVTMDIYPNILPNKPYHKSIVADVAIYPFLKNLVHAVYMERPDPIDHINFDKNPDYNTSYIGRQIDNIMRGMSLFAKLEIEWHPFCTFYTDERLETDTMPLFDQNRIEKDPFIAITDINTVTRAIGMVCHGIKPSIKKSPNTGFVMPKNFKNNVQTLSKVMEELLVFYEQQGLGSQETLKNLLDAEMQLWETFIKQHPCIIKVPYSPTDGPDLFTNSITKNLEVLSINKENGKIILPLLRMTREKGKPFWMSKGQFEAESFFGFLFADAFVSLTKENVKKFLLNKGLTHPSVERKKSDHNGRNNVWIITAFKP